MKRICTLISSILIINLFNSAYAQVWKQYSDSAKVYETQKRTDKAIQYYYKAKNELKTDSMWTNSYAGICYGIGVLYYNMRQYKKTEPLFIETKMIIEKVLGKEHPNYAATCFNLAILNEDMIQYEKAEPLYIEAKKIREKALGKEHPDYTESCNRLASLYFKMGLYEKSEPFFLESKNIREKVLGKEHQDYASSCNNLAILYKEMGLYKKAEPLYVEAKNILDKLLGKEHPDYATTCDGLALLYLTTGQYKRAEPIYIEAKNIREKTLGKNDPDYASSCTNLATLYNRMGHYEKAELLFFEARQIFQKTLGKQHPDYASNCINIANLYMNTGKYEKAELLYVEAKQIREKVLGKENPDYAKVANNLAAFYMNMVEYEKAESLYMETKQIWEKVFGKEHSDYAATCNNLAGLYQKLGQYEKAESLYLESKQINEKTLGKECREYIESCNNLALLYNAMGQFEKSLPLYLEANLITEKVLGKEHPYFAHNCYNLAVLYMHKGQYEKAEPLYFEARQLWEKVLGKEHPDYAVSCYGLAVLYFSMGQYKKAESYYLEAKQIREKILGKEHPDYAKSCNSLGLLYWNLKDYKRAHDFFTEAFTIQYNGVKKMFQFTSETEKQSYLKNITDLGGSSLSFYTTAWSPLRQGFTYNVSLTKRNLILSSSQQLRSAINNTNDTSIKKKYNIWISSREQLSFWYSKPNAERPVYAKDLEERTNMLEKELTSLSAEFRKGQTQKEIDWKAIQQNLKANEAAIEFVRFEYHNGMRWTDSTYYIALVLRKDKPEPELVKLFEKKELNKLLNSRENLATDNRINSLYAGNKSLYNLTWKPLEKYLTGISKVYFASAGDLFKISFAALPVTDKQVLGDKYQLIQLNTTASVIDNDKSNITSADKIQLYGGIRYDADSTTLKHAISTYQSSTASSRSLPADLERGVGFQYLPGTQQETEAIKKQAGNSNASFTILSGINATEESIKALTGKNSPSVLHIATHGFFFPDPKDKKIDDMQRKFETSGKAFKQSDNPLFRSGLLFAGANNAWQGKPIDGIEDGILTAYEVSNMYLPNTKLVVLSACETALGDIQGSEGVYGLQRAFKMAGVQNLVMSLWKVPDAETAEFMQLFYKNLFAKQTISNAFYNAQQVMKNKYRTEPYKWAAWVLVR